MKQKHLVTGASGFIGANLVRRLLSENKEVHILSREESDFWRLKGILSKLNLHPQDTENQISIKKTIKKINPDYIYHLAAYGGYPFQQDVSKMIKTNIIFSSVLLETAKEINLKAFILTGSSSEYGYKNKPMKEDDALKPASFYAATKAATTQLALVYARSFKMPIVIVRPFAVYGPFEEPTRLVPTVIMKCLKNIDIELTDGKEKRDFIYIEDFLDCFLKLAENPGKTSGQIVNIGSGKQFSTREIVKIIHQLTKSRSQLLWGKYPNRLWDAKFWLADINLVKKLVGWQPKRDLPLGIAETITWFQNNLILYENR